MLAFQQNGVPKTAQKTLPPTSDYTWSWYICCSTKLSRQEHNCEIWLLYRELIFEILRHNRGFLGKQSSVLLVLPIGCLLTWTGSRDQLFPCMTSVVSSHNWARKTCDPCWRFWSCFRQTPPLIRAMSSHSAPNLQKQEDMLPLCCFIILFTSLFEGKTWWRVVTWCRGSNRAKTKILT